MNIKQFLKKTFMVGEEDIQEIKPSEMKIKQLKGDRMKIKVGLLPWETRIYLIRKGKSYEIPKVKDIELHVTQDATTEAQITLVIEDAVIEIPSKVSEEAIKKILKIHE